LGIGIVSPHLHPQNNDNLTYEIGAEQMVIPLSESAVTRRMEELNAQAAAFAQNGIGAFPIPDDEVTREAAVRILVDRAVKKISSHQSDLPESELQNLKLRIRSEFDKMYAGRHDSKNYFPSGS
jgi:hypothetical protein